MPRFLLPLFCLALLPVNSALAQAMPGVSDLPRPALQDSKTTPEGGWDGLARWLDSFKPGVDTALAPTASQTTDHIEALLDAGQIQQALTLIQTQQALEQTRHIPSTDVQLAFLHARALAALGEVDAAEQIYQELTTRYPELPEPWNNLAALYLQRNQIELAQQALQTAIRIDPKYGISYANLADIQLMLARQTYETAAQLGVSSAQNRARAISKLLEAQ